MTFQDTKEEPCTILEGPWSIYRGYSLDNPHCAVAWLYGGGTAIAIHAQDWAYGNRWDDPTMYDELAEMIRQAPEVRKERDELRDARDSAKAELLGSRAELTQLRAKLGNAERELESLRQRFQNPSLS